MIQNKLKFGVMGLSDGNGHPYSWSAIINGYDSEYMQKCPFPVISKYLEENEANTKPFESVEVTHIWTQSRQISEGVARCSKISNIVDDYLDMADEVDAILLARDDAENHYTMSMPFLEKGIPVFIDKPLSYTLQGAKNILNLQQYEGQVFTASSILYSDELAISAEQRSSMGPIKYISATVNKMWQKYGIHLIDPVLNIIGSSDGFKFKLVNVSKRGNLQINRFIINDILVDFVCSGSPSAPISINVHGENESHMLKLSNAYNAFRNSLEKYIDSVKSKTSSRSQGEILASIAILEAGLSG